MRKVSVISLIFICLFIKSAICQNISKFDFKAKPKFSGGFNSNVNILKRSGQDLGYFYRFAVNFNVNLWEAIDIPVTFSYSGSQYDFNTVRINRQFGLSPSYKAVTLHLGYRTMNISEFTLNSTQFIGAGINYSNENFPVEIKMMKGELILPLVTFDPAFPIEQLSNVNRNAFAIDIGLKVNNGKTNLSVFKSEDYRKGGEQVDTLEYKPLEENLVVELRNQTDLSDFLNIDIKFAHSLMTLDKESNLTFYDNYSFYNNLGSLFEVNGTSYFSNALVGAVNFNLLGNSVGIRYRKIDPYFRSHGAGFLNNDIEDIMIINSLQFFQNKLSINSSFGRKQDDIKKENNTYTRNIAYGSDISWKEGSGMFLRFSYHNYTSSLNSRLIQQSILNDSLFQFQSRQNLKFNGMFNFSRFFNSINFIFLHQYGKMRNRGNFELLQLMPTLKKEITNSISGQVSYSYMKTTGNESDIITEGPLLKIFGRMMDGKITPVFVFKFITRKTDMIKQKLLNTAFNVRYKINDSNSLYMNSNLILKPSSKDKSQFRTSLNYSYRF